MLKQTSPSAFHPHSYSEYARCAENPHSPLETEVPNQSAKEDEKKKKRKKANRIKIMHTEI